MIVLAIVTLLFVIFIDLRILFKIIKGFKRDDY